MTKQEYTNILNQIKTRSQSSEIKKIDKYVANLKKEFAHQHELEQAYTQALDTQYDKQYHKFGKLENGKHGYIDTRPQEEYQAIVKRVEELEKQLLAIGYYSSFDYTKAIYRDCILKASFNYMAWCLQDLLSEDINSIDTICAFVDYDTSKRGENWLNEHHITFSYSNCRTFQCSYYFGGYTYNQSYYYHTGTNGSQGKLYKLQTLKQIGNALRKLEEENKRIRERIEKAYNEIVGEYELYNLTTHNDFAYGVRPNYY